MAFGLALLLITGGVLFGKTANEKVIYPAPERQEAGQVQKHSSETEGERGSKLEKESAAREELPARRPSEESTAATDRGIREGVAGEQDESLLHGLDGRSSTRGDIVPSRGVRVGVFKVTAYSNGPSETGKSPGDPGYGITASGKPTIAGRTIAADWDVLPPGTTIFIKGVGYRVVEDKGGAIVGSKIDLYMDADHHTLDAWGVQYLEVYVVSKGG